MKKLLLAKNNIKLQFIPAGFTDKLQPCDAQPSPNLAFKENLTEQFESYSAGKVRKGLADNKRIEEIKIDLRTSIIKPIHARWMVRSYNKLKDNTVLIKKAWQTTGLSKMPRT